MRKTNSAQVLPVDVVGSSTFGRYQKISPAKTYNMFISDDWLINFAGYQKAYQFLPQGEGRAVFHSIRGNFILAVISANVYKISSDFDPVLIGNIATSSGEVYVDENLNNQICIVDGVNAYIYNYSLPPNITMQTISGTLIPGYVTYHNTFFLFGNANITGEGAAWYAYSYDTPTTITQTTQLALQTKPDYARAIKRLPGQGNNVLVFGTSVCEIHTQVGGLLNYQRNPTINVDYGCISTSTIASSDRYIAWLAVNERDGPVIMVYSGQGAQPISTDGIDYVMGELKHPEQSTASFYRQDGHLFYQLTFYNDEDNLTLIYDFNNEKFFHLTDGELNYHPARDYVYFNQETYFISLKNASLYSTDTNLTTYNENIAPANDPSLIDEIPRIRICSNNRLPDSSRFRVNSFLLTMEQGNDPGFTELSLLSQNNIIDENEEYLITEDGQNIIVESLFTSGSINNLIYQPRIDISLSADGGVTFGNTVGQTLNPVGKRKNIITWQKLGVYNDLVIKLRFWGTSSFVVNNGLLEITE